MEITKEMKISWVLTREEYGISHNDPKSIVGLVGYAFAVLRIHIEIHLIRSSDDQMEVK